MEYRRASAGDFDQIVALQNRNLYTALSPSERSDGFLSTAFTSSQFAEMDRSLCVAVGVNDGIVRAYCCASISEFNLAIPRPAAALRACDNMIYRGKALGDYRFFLANPICIDKAFRGKGVYLDLCRKVLELVPDDYELALGFVSTSNHRHLQAMKKMGLESVGRFSLGSESFYIIVRPT